MAGQDYQIIAAIYPTEDGAKHTFDQLQQMKKDDLIHIVDAATMRKEADGQVHTCQADIPHAKSAAIKGGVIGAVVGIIFPPTILAATALGAIAGGIPLSQSLLGLLPGTCAIICQCRGEGHVPGGLLFSRFPLPDQLEDTHAPALPDHSNLIELSHEIVFG